MGKRGIVGYFSEKEQPLKPAKKYRVALTTDERQELLKLTGSGVLSARKMKRVLILLKADKGLKDREIIAALNPNRPTVESSARCSPRLLHAHAPRAVPGTPTG